MSYAIIRNAKYKRENLKGIFRHNERRNKNYSNKNIDIEKSYLNYSLKSPQYSYEKEFDIIRKKYNLKGQIKTVSNIACEYIITSDKEFFDTIGENETKRYFETAYKFVSEYKNLGEQYILSAQVHMDEASPHMHLIFLPVIHTKDKKGNDIDKLACSEFWKAKDSYRQLQNAFYEFMVSNGFNLERGLPKEETNRNHYDITEYKRITNFEKSKEILDNITLELPQVPDINDIKLIKLNKAKVAEEIIKPKNELINKLYSENLMLYEILLYQEKLVEEAEEYQKERDLILDDNKKLHNTMENLEIEYNNRKSDLEQDFKYKRIDLEGLYKNKIKALEKENIHLNKIIDKFYDTINKFIKWICKKFSIADSKKLIRDFEIEEDIYFDPKQQIEFEDRENEWDLDI